MCDEIDVPGATYSTPCATVFSAGNSRSPTCAQAASSAATALAACVGRVKNDWGRADITTAVLGG